MYVIQQKIYDTTLNHYVISIAHNKFQLNNIMLAINKELNLKISYG